MENSVLVVGLAVSGFLLSPVIFQYLNRFYVPVTIVAILLLSLNSMAPHSPEARVILKMVHRVPDTLTEAISTGQDNLVKLNTGYFTSFH
jgi:hypothetical protein